VVLFKPVRKRGPKFRAPYSGYSLRQHPTLIPVKRTLKLRGLASTWQKGKSDMSQQKYSGPPGPGEASQGQKQWGRRRKGMCLEERSILEPNAGAGDVGALEIYVAVPPDRD
jgi:hypothetical protein